MSYENTNNVTMLLTHFHHHWKLIIVQLAKVVSCIRPLLPTAILSNSTLLVFRNHDIRRHHYITFTRIKMINTIDLTFFPQDRQWSPWAQYDHHYNQHAGAQLVNGRRIPLGLAALCIIDYYPISNSTIIIIIIHKNFIVTFRRKGRS